MPFKVGQTYSSKRPPQQTATCIAVDDQWGWVCHHNVTSSSHQSWEEGLFFLSYEEFTPPIKVEGWVNIYNETSTSNYDILSLWRTKEKAIKRAEELIAKQNIYNERPLKLLATVFVNGESNGPVS